MPALFNLKIGLTKIQIFIFLIIIFSAFFLRFYELSNFPKGLNQDESAIGYNAYSILETGRDEHGKKMPLYFESFGDYKLPGYIYLTVLSERVFGVNEFGVRFWSAFLGSISVIVIFFFVKDLTKSNSVALLSSFLLAINPWQIFFSRAAFEVNAANSFLLFGIYCFYASLKRKYGVLFLFSSILFIGASVYTYNVTRLVAPLVLTLFIVYFRREFIQNFNRLIILIFGILFVFTLLPFIITLLSNSGLDSQKTIMIFGGNRLAERMEMRAIIYTLPVIVTKLFFNMQALLAFDYVKNIVASFNPVFFFTSADPDGTVMLPNMGGFYVFEFITIIAGVVEIIRNKVKNLYPLIIWFLIGVFVVGISGVVPRTTRSFVELIPLIIISAYGLYFIIKKIAFLKNKYFKFGSYSLVTLTIIYCFTYFLISYFSYYPAYYSFWWRPQEKELSYFLNTVGKDYGQIEIDKSHDIVYTSFAFYNKFSPSDFQKNAVWDPDIGSGFRKVNSFGKYNFASNIDWEYEMKQPSKLIIISNKFMPTKLEPVKEIKSPLIPIAFPENDRIHFQHEQKTYFRIFSTEDCMKKVRPNFREGQSEKEIKKIYELCI